MIRHPVSDCVPVAGCEVTLSAHEPCSLRVEYAVTGDIAAIRLPAIAAPGRRDNLWQSTCFELFVALDDGGYLEFNFAPSTCWAAYHFDGYRTGMRPVSGVEPLVGVTVTDKQLGVSVQLDLTGIVPDLARSIGLSAVIEQADGAKSWWALAHPLDKPDFHHRDCFVLQPGAAEEL